MEEIRRQDSKPHLVPINYMTSGVILLETQTTSALYTQNIYLEGLSENKGSRQPFVENGISHSTTAATGMPRRRPSGPFRGRGAPGSRRGAAPGLSPGPCRPPPSRRVARASRPPACPLAPEAARARSPPATWPPLVVPASHLVPRVGLTARGQPPRSASCLTSARPPSSAPRKRQPCARPSFACALPAGSAGAGGPRARRLRPGPAPAVEAPSRVARLPPPLARPRSRALAAPPPRPLAERPERLGL